MNTNNVKIGQAIVSCVSLIADRKNELEFTWVQFGRDFELLVGQCLEYPTMLPKSKIRLGDRTKGDRQAIVFDPCYNKESMVDGRQYAVLIRWNPASKDIPEILGFGSKKSFDDAVEALKTLKDTFVPSTPREEEAPKKGNFKFEVVQDVEDSNFYRVNTCGRTSVGKIKDIVLKMTHQIEADPTEMLLLGKGLDNRYTRCGRPNIPNPPEMLIKTYEKKRA